MKEGMIKSMNRWRAKCRHFSIFGFIALFLSGCGKPYLSTLRPAGEVADKEYSLMVLSTGLMIIVIVAVTLIFIYVLFRFRQRRGSENQIPEQIVGNHKLEVVWTVIPILLIIILAVPTVLTTFELADVTAMEEASNDEEIIVVNVRANQYWWEFEYPKYGVITSQDLYVPTDEKVYFNVKAADVKHSFWIPAIGGKLDMNTDTNNKFYLEFDQEKTNESNEIFYGKCAELCGPSHAYMDFKVKPLPREEFDNWIKKMQNASTTVSTDLATQGEEIFGTSCITCHAVSPQDKRPDVARIAPNLANFGDRERIAGVLEHNKENLKNWIKDPDKYKPGNKMTGTYGTLTDNEINALSEYLMGLKIE